MWYNEPLTTIGLRKEYDWHMTQLVWRLLITGFMDGPANMALDQAILEAVARGAVPPTLRFYGWTPACLSLGYTQPVSDVDEERLAKRGWQLVRRLTGGRAILHTDELTYSIAFPAQDPIVQGDIVSSYRRLSAALLAGLSRLGADAHADRQTSSTANHKGPVCFEVPSHYEITVDGKKLIGSAQVRKFNGVLQHGSFPLTGDIARICDALVFDSVAARAHAQRNVVERATTLEAAIGRAVPWQEAAEVLAGSFKDTFEVAAFEGDLTTEERDRAAALVDERYATQEWNARF